MAEQKVEQQEQVTSVAVQEGEVQKSPQSSILGMLPIVIIFVIFYFLIIRPQSKKAKEDQQMRNTLQIGNKVVTTSGIFGTISEIDNTKEVVSLTIAKDVSIVVLKSSIASILKEEQQK